MSNGKKAFRKVGRLEKGNPIAEKLNQAIRQTQHLPITVVQLQGIDMSESYKKMNAVHDAPKVFNVGPTTLEEVCTMFDPEGAITKKHIDLLERGIMKHATIASTGNVTLEQYKEVITIAADLYLNHLEREKAFENLVIRTEEAFKTNEELGRTIDMRDEEINTLRQGIHGATHIVNTLERKIELYRELQECDDELKAVRESMAASIMNEEETK